MDKLEELVSRLEKVTVKFEGLEGGVSAAAPGSASVAGIAPAKLDSVASFQKLLEDNKKKIEEVTGKLGKIVPWAKEIQEEIQEVTGWFLNAFEAETIVVDAMSQCRNPSQPELQKLVQPVVALMNKTAEKTQGKKTELFNHLNTLSEALQSLTWVVLSGDGAEKPPMHITQCWQSAEFYTNKIMKEFRKSDPAHVEWIEAIKTLVKGLGTYCTKFHLGQPQWKKGGISVSEFLGADPPVESAPAPASDSPEPSAPPPPKAPKPEFPSNQPAGLPKVHPTRSWQPEPAGKSTAELAADVFAGKKQGLRNVSDTEKAKNQPGRSGLVPVKLKPTSDSQVKIGKTELVMERKWSVEGHKGNKDIVLDVTPRQTLYIYKCEDCVIKVNGKINVITLDLCKRTGLLFETAMSSVEIVNSSQIDIQCMGTIGTLVIEKCDGCNVYIPDTSMHVEITTAKSSGINVNVTGGEDMKETFIPDQYISKFEDGVLVTRPSEHAGA